MIIAINATAKKIAESGDSFQWPNVNCEKCSRVMWSHGFVSRYFEGISKAIRIKRCRCPSCGSLAVFRPIEFLPFFRSSIATIYSELSARLNSGCWSKGFSRQRGGYWMAKLAVALKLRGVVDPVRFLRERLEKNISFFV